MFLLAHHKRRSLCFKNNNTSFSCMTLLFLSCIWIALLSRSCAYAADSNQQDEEVDVDGTPDDTTPEKDWYQRYPQYPKYCSTPEQLSLRTIPPLPSIRLTGGDVPETRLRHVTSIIRHGATTIQSKESPCWDGYWDNPETAIWHCPLTERLAPPTPKDILEDEGSAAQFTALDSMFLFQKNYDTRPNHNVLEGTCQLGQLMAQGYEQLTFIGEMLRETYFYQEGTMGHDERMRLYSLPRIQPGVQSPPQQSHDSQIDPWEEPNFYLRSENTQPTLVSGQLIMQGLFGPELAAKHQTMFHDQTYATVNVHTGDMSRDIMTGYHNLATYNKCPKLDLMKSNAESSEEFQNFIQSESSQEVQQFINKHLTYDTQLFNCLMTTVCTDRPLPERFGIYSPNPKSWFERISKFHATNHSFHYQSNDAEYSKLNMGPLWAEILEHIVPVLKESDEAEQGERERPPSKMALYAGEDTTIIQLLSSLGVWSIESWPPYASMVVIEIHEMVDDNYNKQKFKSGYAFRLIYDGKVLTSAVAGCGDGNPDNDKNGVNDLCDAQILLNHLSPIATRTMNCSLSDGDLNGGDGRQHNAMVIAKGIVSDTVGILLLLVVVMASAFVGSICVYLYLTGTLPSKDDVEKVVRSTAATAAVAAKKKISKTKEVVDGSDNATSGGYHDRDNGRASAGIEPFEITMADGEAYED